MLANRITPRVLIGNIYFSPTSFGGATVIAEDMAHELKNSHGWDVIVVASVDDPSLAPYGIRRYATKGIDVIGVRIPEQSASSQDGWHNTSFNKVFGQILDLTRPDIVHMHCVQNMGGSALSEVTRRDIPLAVTVHDCWWLCERQFMINHAGQYCDQTKIDLSVCRYCVPDIRMTQRRMEMLKKELANADLLLFPSEFHRSLHVANGFDPSKCVVNKNGVSPPRPGFQRIPNEDPEITVRFGFVGGPGPIKGASLIKKAFDAISRKDYELRVVDAAINLGRSWRNDPVWKVPGKVTFVPGYTKETMDDFFASIDVLLFPSQWKESFGLTVREAMLRGVWVIATDAGGLSEDFRDGENATVIPFGNNSNALKEAIEKVFDMPLSGEIPSSHISLVSTQAKDLHDRLIRLANTYAEAEMN